MVARVPLLQQSGSGPRAASGRQTSGRHTAGQKPGRSVVMDCSSPGFIVLQREWLGDTGGGSHPRSAVGLPTLGGCMGRGKSRRGREAESQGEYASRTALVGCENRRFGAGRKADAGPSGEPYLPRTFLQRR